MWDSIKDAEEIDKLKGYSKGRGGFKGVKAKIKQDLGIKEETFKSWSGLIEFILFFNSNFERKKLKTESDESCFKSEADKYIFGLCKLDGKNRADLLEITKEHYSSLKLAKEWRNRISKKIHPDICNKAEAETAMAKLNDIYEGMIRYGE